MVCGKRRTLPWSLVLCLRNDCVFARPSIYGCGILSAHLFSPTRVYPDMHRANRGDPHTKSCTCAKFLGILGIFGIFGNALIISIMMLHITTYILIDPLIRVIRTYITSYTILPILIFILKTNNLDKMPKYTLNLSLNSRLRQIPSTLDSSLFTPRRKHQHLLLP